jgi:hypothetical protein
MYAPLKRRPTIILHGSITQKTTLNIVYISVWNRLRKVEARSSKNVCLWVMSTMEAEYAVLLIIPTSIISCLKKLSSELKRQSVKDVSFGLRLNGHSCWFVFLGFYDRVDHGSQSAVFFSPNDRTHRGLGWKSLPGDRLSLQRGFVVFLSPSRHIPEWCLKIRPRPMPTNPFRFNIRRSLNKLPTDRTRCTGVSSGQVNLIKLGRDYMWVCRAIRHYSWYGSGFSSFLTVIESKAKASTGAV